MQAHPPDIQFIVGGLVLILVAILALAAVLEDRKKKNRRFPNYFCANFDPSEFEQQVLRQGSFAESEDLYPGNPSSLQAYDANNKHLQIGERE